MASRSTAGPAKTPAKSKTSAPSKPSSKPELEVVSEKTAAQIASPVLKKRELMQLVAARAELGNNKVKPVMEAMLAVLGEAIAEGRELNLPPFGRVKINRQKDTGPALVTVTKIRQVKSSGESGDS